MAGMAPEKVANECGVCRQPTLRMCEECGVWYCYGCKEQEHWMKCRNFQVDLSGVSVIAKRDLLPGEIVFSEDALVIGPKLPPEEGYMPCVGCCRVVPLDKLFYCPECAWPACNPQCEDLKNTKTHALECQALKLDNKTRLENTKKFRFELLLPLRILFLQTTNKTEWENITQQLEKNNEEVVDSNFNNFTTQNDNVEFLQDNFLTPLSKIEEETCTTMLEEKSKNFLHKIFDFVKTTTFEQPNDGHPLKIFYPTAHLIHHSCTPNSFQTISKTSSPKITVRATSPISKNTPITCSYTNLFQGTHERLSHLKTTKNCFCSCDRCSDSTEFGTFFSALKCFGTKIEPCGGTQLPVDPTNVDTIWVCDTCKIELPNDQIVKFVRHLGREVSKVVDMKPTVDEVEEFLAKLLMFFHPNHFYVCQVKHVLVKMYEGEDLAMTKVEVCRSLVEIARKLYPFGSLFLVELLHELFEARISLLMTSEDLVKNEDVEELANILTEMESVTEAFFDQKLSEIVSQDKSIFTNWLNICH